MRPASPSSVAEKNSVWRCCGQARDDPVDGRAEAHVEHPVGLVEDEELEVVEAHDAARHQVLEAAGRGDEDVGALARLDLLLEADAAVDGRDLEPLDAGERLGLLDDLGGELAGRREHERGGAAARLDALDHRDRERERLARARGGLGEHVAAVEHVADDEPLDGEGLGDAALGEGRDNRARHADIGERLGLHG